MGARKQASEGPRHHKTAPLVIQRDIISHPLFPPVQGILEEFYQALPPFRPPGRAHASIARSSFLRHLQRGIPSRRGSRRRRWILQPCHASGTQPSFLGRSSFEISHPFGLLGNGSQQVSQRRSRCLALLYLLINMCTSSFVYDLQLENVIGQYPDVPDYVSMSRSVPFHQIPT